MTDIGKAPEAPKPASEAMRETLNDLADRIERMTEDLGDAAERFGERVHRFEDALHEAGEDLERPAARLARALDDFTCEVRRSFDRATGRERRRSRIPFWR